MERSPRLDVEGALHFFTDALTDDIGRGMALLADPSLEPEFVEALVGMPEATVRAALGQRSLLQLLGTHEELSAIGSGIEARFVPLGGRGSGNFGHKGRPGEVGGSGEATVFHGTTTKVLQKILKEGLRGDKSGVFWPELAQKGHVYLTSDFNSAQHYAGEAAHNLNLKAAFRGRGVSALPIVLEVHVPKEQLATDENFIEMPEEKLHFQFKGSIPKEWIKSVRTWDFTKKTWVKRTLAASGDVVLFVPFALLASEEELRDAGGKGSGNFGHAGRPGEVGGSAESSAVPFDADPREQYPNAPELREFFPEDVKRAKAVLKFNKRLNSDGTVSYYHATLEDHVESILKHGLIPAKEAAAGQDWKADHAAYATYFHGVTDAAIKDTAYGGITIIEARIPITPETLGRFVPDEDSGRSVWEGFDALKTGEAIAFIGGVPASALRVRPDLVEVDPEFKGLGGRGSGNFGHSGRPGEVGGSGPGIAPEGAVLASHQRLDVNAKGLGHRRFLFDPDRRVAVLGAFRPDRGKGFPLDSEGEDNHAVALDNALEQAEIFLTTPDVSTRYDDYTLRGYIRQGRIDVMTAPYKEVARIDAVYSLATRLVRDGAPSTTEIYVGQGGLPGWPSSIWTLGDAFPELFYRKRAAAAQPWAALHAAADAHLRTFRRLVLRAFRDGQKDLTVREIRKALADKDSVEKLFEPALERVRAKLEKTLPGALLGVLEDGGDVAAAQLRGYLRAAGGPGSGNFGHAGRPGEVGGSAESTLGPLEAKIIEPSQRFDMQAFKERPFLFNPESSIVVLGAEESAKTVGSWRTHAETLDNAIKSDEEFDRFGDYDSYSVRGWLRGQDKNEIVIDTLIAPHIEDTKFVDTNNPESVAESFDLIDALVKRLVSNGANANTTLDTTAPIAKVLGAGWPDLFKKPRTLGGPGSGNFGHAGRPGEVGGSSPSNFITNDPELKPIADLLNDVELKQDLVDSAKLYAGTHQGGAAVSTASRQFMAGGDDALLLHAAMEGAKWDPLQRNVAVAAKQMVTAVRNQPERERTLFRAVSSANQIQMLDKAEVGSSLTLGKLTSFSSSAEEAGYYAGTWTATSFLLKLEGPSKAFGTDRLTRKTHQEYVTQGKFEVIDVRPPTEEENKFNLTPQSDYKKVITIKQVGVF